MSKTMVQGSARTLPQVPGAQAVYQQGAPPSPPIGWLETVRVWIARRRQRRALGELGELNDARLRDIGVSQDEARREAAKPFWKR